jgi:hypothetical protein
LKINEKICDNVVSNITVSDVVGTKALVRWTAPVGDADVQYRVAGTGVWSAPITVSADSLLLTTLPLKSDIELQVRSKCTPNSFGAWSETVAFFSGYEIPFSENFDAIANNKLPGGWKIETGDIATPTVFTNAVKIIKGVTNKLIAFDYNAALNDWIVLPLLDLGDGSANYKFEFKIQQLQGVLSSLSADNYLAVVISDDGGKTFNESGILKKFTTSNNSYVAGDYSLSLQGHTGVVQLAFYVKSTSPETAHIIAGIDNVAVLPSCPPAENVAVSDLAERSAKVTWQGTADAWLVFVRKAGETGVNYQSQTAKELVLSDLIPATGYEVGVTKSCGNQDTARVIIVSFITLPAAPCPEVTTVTTNTYQSAAEIAWVSDAVSFKFNYRRTNAQNWIESTLTTPSIRLDDLVSNAGYEFRIQAICSNASGDQSEWVNGTFTTRELSCFAPTAITSTAITYKSATVTWTGEANKYEFAYRVGNAEWTTRNVENASTITLTGLTPSTTYSIRVRSICSDDISAWATASFTTTEVTCLVPTNLLATGITPTTAQLSWDADDDNLTWNLRYREGAITSWTTINNLSAKSYKVEGLQSNTAYLWTVRGICDAGLTSGWATQSEYSTLISGITKINKNDLNVFATGKIINIVNPSAQPIDRVELIAANGSIIKNFTVHSNENVLIPVTLSQQVVIVNIITGNASVTFKVLIK